MPNRACCQTAGNILSWVQLSWAQAVLWGRVFIESYSFLGSGPSVLLTPGAQGLHTWCSGHGRGFGRSLAWSQHILGGLPKRVGCRSPCWWTPRKCCRGFSVCPDSQLNCTNAKKPGSPGVSLSSLFMQTFAASLCRRFDYYNAFTVLPWKVRGHCMERMFSDWMSNKKGRDKYKIQCDTTLLHYCRARGWGAFPSSSLPAGTGTSWEEMGCPHELSPTRGSGERHQRIQEPNVCFGCFWPGFGAGGGRQELEGELLRAALRAQSRHQLHAAT